MKTYSKSDAMLGWFLGEDSRSQCDAWKDGGPAGLNFLMHFPNTRFLVLSIF